MTNIGPKKQGTTILPNKSEKVTFSRNGSAEQKIIIIEDEDENEDKKDDNLKSMTMLPPDAIRWMNKRRPLNQTVAKATHIPPHKASQLREMFDGLDIDGGGEIDLKEFKDAIAYVSEHSTVGTGDILGDPKNVTAIFRAMDTDGSGTVDFNEFVIAMTADNSGAANSSDLSKLQSTFYDFANIHRRQNMLELIKNKTVGDLDKFQEFERLFKVEYFHDEELQLSVEEQLAKTTKEVLKEKKKLGKVYKEKRQLEIFRSRAADCYAKSEKHRLMSEVVPGRKFEIPDINNVSKQHSKRKKFSKRMECFSIQKETFLPTLEDKQKIRQRRETSVKELNSSRAINKELLLPPPISVKNNWEEKASTFMRTGEF